MNNVTIELLALVIVLAGTLVVAFGALKRSAEAQSIASATTSQLLETLGDFGKTLQATNQERELWQSERRVLERRVVSLESQVEAVKADARRQIDSAKNEAQMQIEVVKQEAAERERRLVAEIESLKAMLVLEREQRQREVKSLRDDLEIERRKRKDAEDAKKQLSVQLEQLRHELSGKADKIHGVDEHGESTEQPVEADAPSGLDTPSNAISETTGD